MLTQNRSQTLPLFNLGFRPFFFGASVFAILSVCMWLAVYILHIPLPVDRLTIYQWHAHEMIYGYSLAVIAGFLLTAVTNWTGIQTVHGWLLAGVEASPGDLALAVQSATILGLGFAFLLAMFPLYTWLPMLAEEVSPYVLGFLFWVLPTITIIFGMGFLDRYSWLRTSGQLSQVMSVGGLLMVVTGGLWSAFQRHLSRQMAYAVVAETGFSLLALSLPPEKAVDAVFLLIIPRSLALLVWTVQKTNVARRRSAEG